MSERTKWRLVWLAFFTLVMLFVSFVACTPLTGPQTTPRADYDGQLLDLAWLSLRGTEQIALCEQWEDLGEDSWRQLLRTVGTGNVPEDAWIAAMERHC